MLPNGGTKKPIIRFPAITKIAKSKRNFLNLPILYEAHRLRKGMGANTICQPTFTFFPVKI